MILALTDYNKNISLDILILFLSEFCFFFGNHFSFYFIIITVFLLLFTHY